MKVAFGMAFPRAFFAAASATLNTYKDRALISFPPMQSMTSKSQRDQEELIF